MRNWIVGLFVLSCCFALYVAAPQAVDPTVTPAPTPTNGTAPCKHKGRKGRSINATTVAADGIKIAEAIGAVIKKNVKAISAEIDKQIASQSGTFRFSSNQQPPSNIIANPLVLSASDKKSESPGGIQLNFASSGN